MQFNYTVIVIVINKAILNFSTTSAAAAFAVIWRLLDGYHALDGLETLDPEAIDLAFEYEGLDPAMYEHLVRIEGNIYIRTKSTIRSPLHLSCG